MGFAILLWIFQLPSLDNLLCCLQPGKDNKAVVNRRIFWDRGILNPSSRTKQALSPSKLEGRGGGRSSLTSGKRDEHGVKQEHLPCNSLFILQKLPMPVNKHDQNTEVSSLDNARQRHEEGRRVKKVKLC